MKTFLKRFVFSGALALLAPDTVQACWTGHFTGPDTSGYAIDIQLTERNGRVEGGYSYFHKGAGKSVRAVILDAVVEGDALKGRWKQVEGIPAEGSFRWGWLAGQRCTSFEGSFDGTRYWGRMSRSGH